MMDRTLKALSLVLSYPTAELQAAMPAIGAVFAADPRISPQMREALRFLSRIAKEHKSELAIK